MAKEGMMDQFTAYFNAVNGVKDDSLYAPLVQEEGSIHGIGANLSLVHFPPVYDGEPPPSGTSVTYVCIVESVERRAPASGALRKGDVILEVDGAALDYGRRLYLPEEVAGMIRGPMGSGVAVAVQREGRRLEFEFRREPRRLPPTATPVTPEHGRAVRSEDDLFLREECPPFPPSRVFKY